MEILIINIGASSDHFGGYAENCPGIYGAGNTAKECRESILDGLRLYKEHTPSSEWPEILQGEYQIEYHFDTQSILNYYSHVFTAPALEKITGINQKQLHHYASGLKKPREAQRKKIENALHTLGEELLTVTL